MLRPVTVAAGECARSWPVSRFRRTAERPQVFYGNDGQQCAHAGFEKAVRVFVGITGNAADNPIGPVNVALVHERKGGGAVVKRRVVSAAVRDAE